MLSKKAEYALRALLHLAKRYGKDPVLISDLADAENIPKKFLESILLDLRHHGILWSKKGKGGGYALRMEPAAVKIGDVVRIIDGPLAPIPCASESSYQQCEDCKDEDTCGVRIVMKEVRDAIAGVLDTKSLADTVGLSERALRSKRRRAAQQK